jgi:hypothetical protein
LVVEVAVGVLEDELFATEGRLGVVLLQNVELAKLHPARTLMK